MAWWILAVYGTALFILAPRSRDAASFFRGTDRHGRQVGYWLLAGSVLVSWIFAKSLTNAANLGASFGLTGGLAYAAWYLSIPVGGAVIVDIRRRHGADSLASFLCGKYGRAASLAFMLAVFIRLYNEVWSNTMVVGTYFGEKGSPAYYAACVVFTGLTLAYSLRGGLRGSIITDAVQLVLMGVFLALVLGALAPRLPEGGAELPSAGELTLRGGLDLLLVGLLQSLSYPFHDPVLTDRAFLSDSRTTMASFATAGLLGMAAIVAFSLVGVYAGTLALPVDEDAPRRVAASLGVGVLLTMNLVMLTSAGSTLDSTFAALARQLGIDLPHLTGRGRVGRLATGRGVMVAMALLGNLPLLTGARILQATTLSGTMVLGLAPVFVLHRWERAGPWAFHLAFWPGLLVGLAEAVGAMPAAVALGDGRYASLLGANLWGLGLVGGLFALGAMLGRRGAPRRP